MGGKQGRAKRNDGGVGFIGEMWMLIGEEKEWVGLGEVIGRGGSLNVWHAACRVRRAHLAGEKEACVFLLTSY